jgi:predicted lipoprotein with Yx(FWY)xxD motif
VNIVRILRHPHNNQDKELRMKRKVTLFIAAAALAAAALVAAVLGDTSSASSQQPSRGARVALGKTTLGKVLVDARGRTLYLFARDKGGRSACNGVCATYWPPLVSSAKPQAARGVRASLLALTKRADGRRQVTYAGHPLYTFSLDTRAGQTSGQGRTDFGGSWNAVAASGRAVKSAASSDGSGSDGGYGGYGTGG